MKKKIKNNIMQSIILVSLLLLMLPILSMDKNKADKIDMKNHAQVISFIESLCGQTFRFNGSCTDLFDFPDYQDETRLYRVPFNTLKFTIQQIFLLYKKESRLSKKSHDIYKTYEKDRKRRNFVLRALYMTITEEDIYQDMISLCYELYNLGDFATVSKNDVNRDLETIKMNRATFFDALSKADARALISCMHSPILKKPNVHVLESLNRELLRLETKGEIIIDSPENSDDENLTEEQKKGRPIDEVVARINKRRGKIAP